MIKVDANIWDANLEHYFDSLHSSTWSRSFEIAKADSRHLAKEFITNFCFEMGLIEFSDPVEMGQENQL